jgi:hypothetical protein
MSTQFTNRQWRLPNNENKDKQSNYSMDFDSASSDYIDCGNFDPTQQDDNGSLPYSISLWVNITYTGGNQIIVSKQTNSGSYNGFSVSCNNVNITFFLGSGLSPQARIIGYANFTGYFSNWTNICLIYDGSRDISGFNLYFNGQNQTINTTANQAPQNVLNTANFEIGSRGGGSLPFNDQIDAVSIFNYALTDGTGGTVNQIAALYGSSSTGIGNPMSLSPKPVAYYPLGDQDAFNGANYLVPNSSLKDYVFDFIPNDYIDCGDSDDFSFSDDSTDSPFSVSTWVNFNDITNSSLFSKTNVAPSFWEYTVHINSDEKIYFGLYSQGDVSGSNYIFVGSTATLTSYEGSWINLTFTYDGSGSVSGLKIYLNGDEMSTSTFVNGTYIAMVNTAAPFKIGRSFSNRHLNGSISNVQIFNTALPATGSNSVETLYNNGSPLTSMSGFTSLQGWWKLDASATFDSSTTTWTIEDSSSNSNDGTSSGMTQANLVQSDLSFTSGYSPYALDFDSASSDYIALPTITLTDNWSVSVWMNQTTTRIRSQAVGSSTGSGFWAYSGDIRSGGGDAGKLLYYNGTSLVALSAERLDDGLWHNWIITYDHSTTTLKCYIDGQENYNDTYNAGTGNTIDRISNTFATNYWLGQLSNISIWNTALTSAQVTEVYNERVPSNLNNHSAYSNLVSWWQLGSNSSFNTNWTVLDEKGSNNGTSVNMGEDAIVDGVGSYANGLSSGMGGDEVIGDAPYSSSNSLSVNMDVEDRVTDTPS